MRGFRAPWRTKEASRRVITTKPDDPTNKHHRYPDSNILKPLSKQQEKQQPLGYYRGVCFPRANIATLRSRIQRNWTYGRSVSIYHNLCPIEIEGGLEVSEHKGFPITVRRFSSSSISVGSMSERTYIYAGSIAKNIFGFVRGCTTSITSMRNAETGSGPLSRLNDG